LLVDGVPRLPMPTASSAPAMFSLISARLMVRPL
jgi:hypothetical protein